MNQYSTVSESNCIDTKAAFRKFMSLLAWRSVAIITAALALPLGSATAESKIPSLLDAPIVNQPSIAIDVSYVPIVFRNVSGTRPFVQVIMNGVQFQMMVHANA